MRAALGGYFDLVLPSQVIVEASRHLPSPGQTETLRFFLEESRYEELRMPSEADLQGQLDLVRSRKDVPIALALLDGRADIFVSNDRDFTDPGATTVRFQSRVRVMLPAVFLRDVVGWSSEALERIRTRSWKDLGGQ